MATRRQPLIPGWLIPGLIAAILMVVVSLGAFLALWFNAPERDLVALWHDSYLWHVVRFSFWPGVSLCPVLRRTGDFSGSRSVPTPLSRETNPVAPVRHDADFTGTGRRIWHSERLRTPGLDRRTA